MTAYFTVNAFCIYFLVLCLNSITDAKLTNNVLNHNAELLRNIRSYEIVKPYRLEGRVKRHLSTKLLSASHVQATTMVFPARKKRFHLNIALNKELFSPEFEKNSLLQDSHAPVQQKRNENCFYHGTVEGEADSAVSLSTCDGIEGVIRSNDGTFFIHPLKSKDGQVLDDHILFDANDVDEQPATCGHASHKTSQKKEINYKRSTHNLDLKSRLRRNVDTEEKFVELYIVNDFEQYRKYGENSELRAKQIVNHLDSIYRFRNIRVALVKVDTWSTGNKINVHRNASITLNNFMKYKKETLDSKILGEHWDNVQLLTGIDFLGTTVGYAPIRSICGERSGGVVMDYSKQAAVTASTMAHELGHNFGLIHDEENCECPDRDDQCVMSAFLSKAATKFSTCSLNDLRRTLEDGYGSCLFDEPKKLVGDAICGNGFVEEGEQCDCGTQEECDHFENKCCNATSCMLFPEAACSHGECCDKCQIVSRGKLCRDVHDDCDLPEYCNGKSELCPEDHHVYNGIPCRKHDGYCYEGVCRSIEQQCKYLFTDGDGEDKNDIRAGNDRCFARNTQGILYNCYNQSTHKTFSCPPEDVKCGRIHCLANNGEVRLKRGQSRRHQWLTFDRKTYCIFPTFTYGDGVDLQYVQNGAKCAEGKMCMNSRCIPVNEAIPISAYDKCKSNCSGNGVCNELGNCHCNAGYACPDCSKFGSDQGGSINSGQGCTISTSGGANVAAAVLIPLFLILLIVAGVLIYWKRRAIQDRLSHYKFVRRTTGTSSKSSPAKKSQASVLHPGLISDPSPVQQPAVQTRRAPPPPVKPTAPLVFSEQPEPMSTPQQAFQGPRRPPTASVQPQTGHQSVALYPPSAAPVSQEKPRPHPSTRPLIKSNLPRTPSAPPTNPNRPKLPPSQPPPNYKSTPDIPSASQPKTTPPTAQRAVPPRPKPRAAPGSHLSVPEFPDNAVPVPKPRNVAPRPGHQSVPLFNLPDNPEDVGSVRPSAVKASQAKPSPPRKPLSHEALPKDESRVDFRAGLKPVPKPWDKI